MKKEYWSIKAQEGQQYVKNHVMKEKETWETWRYDEMEYCASTASMLTEEIWQIAEGFVEIPPNLQAQFKKCRRNVTNDLQCEQSKINSEKKFAKEILIVSTVWKAQIKLSTLWKLQCRLCTMRKEWFEIFQKTENEITSWD